MDYLPTYSSSAKSPPPPSYEASLYAAQQEQESIWPRNYRRETPRIDVVKFYHDLILTCPQDLQLQQVEDPFQSDDDDDDMLLPLSPSSSRILEQDDSIDSRAISELNEVLLQTWAKNDSIPSYEAFKAQVNKNQSFRPISNSLFRSSST